MSEATIRRVRTAPVAGFGSHTILTFSTKLLSIQGGCVAIDAMGCQKAIATDIIASQADYVLSLKTNHPHLCLSVAAWFDKVLAEGFGKHACSHFLEPAGKVVTGVLSSANTGSRLCPATLKGLPRLGVDCKP